MSAFSGPQKRGAKRERKAQKRMEAEERGRRRPVKDDAPKAPSGLFIYPLEDADGENE